MAPEKCGRTSYAGRVKPWSGRVEHVAFVVSAVFWSWVSFAWVVGCRAAAEAVWWLATAFGLALSTGWLVQELRGGHLTVDVVAWLALLGTLLVDEALAGAIITLMLTTGRVLEARAQARAQRELTLLVARAPRTARRAGRWRDHRHPDRRGAARRPPPRGLR